MQCRLRCFALISVVLVSLSLGQDAWERDAGPPPSVGSAIAVSEGAQAAGRLLQGATELHEAAENGLLGEVQ